MQGFNKYYPPDFDGEKHGSLNSYRGKHALGDRARKIDQGILITRFELPFNIWCGTCNNHIGMGVRYNAEKKKIGAYYSTPIFSFRCKCHLCDGWFEIQTDPKNTQYVVTSGARRKEEDWNPEENGGYGVHDTEKALVTVDPLAALEKTTTAQTQLTNVQIPRLESLQSVSEHYNADPFTLSTRVRKRFREEKKVDKAKKAIDDEIKGRYGLPETLPLIPDDESTSANAHELWQAARSEADGAQARKRRKLQVDIITTKTAAATVTPSRRVGDSRHSPLPETGRRPPKISRSPSHLVANKATVSSLRARIMENTARQLNPFNTSGRSSSKDPPKKQKVIMVMKKS